MKTSFYLIIRYWRQHKKDLAALIFSAVLITAITLVFWLLQREKTNRYFNDYLYSSSGMHELAVYNSNDELKSFVLSENRKIKTASAYKFGDFGEYAFGTVDDPHNIMRIKLESGRLPRSENEIAVDRAVLDALYWTGKIGDSITFENKEYTVSGILDISLRNGSTLGMNRIWSMLDGNEMPDCEVLPLIIFSELEGTPQARIDYFTGIVNKKLTVEEVYSSPEFTGISDGLYERIDPQKNTFDWDFAGAGTVGGLYSAVDMRAANFYSLLFIAGAIVASLSVFTVLRSVFQERENNISILKRLGMSRKKRFGMYFTEYALLTAFTTLTGFIAGSAAYGVIFAVKVLFLGESNAGGFTNDYYVTSRSVEPFAFAGIFSAAIIFAAYFLNLATVKIKYGNPSKTAKPRRLRRCYNRIFRGGIASFVQIACIAVICVSVVFSYMYSTYSGKYVQSVMLGAPSEELTAGGVDMKKTNVAEYYFCTAPQINGVGNINYLSGTFSTTQKYYDAGFGDALADTLPEYAFSAGLLEQPFIISDKADDKLGDRIDFSEQNVRDLLLGFSPDEFQNFFEEGQIGSKNLYRAPTCLADEKVIKLLSEYVRKGEIDLDKLNAGEEILVVSASAIPKFNAGDELVFGSAQSGEDSFGMSELNVTAPIKIGAVIKISDNADPLLKRLAASPESRFSFLTTAAGADRMGLHNARYTEVFSTEVLHGSPFPTEAKMKLISVKQLKAEALLRRLKNSAGVILTLIFMSILGFSAYFNGISMKIRQKSYEISILRAQGAAVSKLKKILLFESLKIPFSAALFAYAALKFAQRSANSLANKWDSLWTAGDEFVMKLSETIFMSNNWWQTAPEIPVLIFLALFTAVTFILTVCSLNKFGKNIADDLNAGRKRH